MGNVEKEEPANSNGNLKVGPGLAWPGLESHITVTTMTSVLLNYSCGAICLDTRILVHLYSSTSENIHGCDPFRCVRGFDSQQDNAAGGPQSSCNRPFFDKVAFNYSPRRGVAPYLHRNTTTSLKVAFKLSCSPLLGGSFWFGF